MGNPTTIKSRTDQANVMATTGTKVSDNVQAFDRYLAMVAGQLCEHSQRNGHITPEAAAKCGQAMAEAEIQSMPADISMESKITAAAITLVTQPRFKCSKG